jgi:predicted transcriptional regulator
MSDTTTIRISRATHDELRHLARERHQTVAETISRAVRLLRQDDIGRGLATPLTGEEATWLDADTR